MKKMFALLLSLTLLMSMFPAGAYAEKEGKKDSGAKEIAEEIIRQNKNRDPFDYLTKEEKNDLKLDADRPEKALVKNLKPGKKSLTVTLKDQKKTGVSKYEVQYRKAGSKKWSKKTFSSKKNKLTLKKLKKGKKYEVQVRAYAKDAGYGEMSKVMKSRKIK